MDHWSEVHQLWRALDQNWLHNLLRELVNIYSPSGKEEDIQLYLEQTLQGGGLAVHRQEVEDKRCNLVATLGWGEPRLYLVGHVDTITAWDLEDYEAREENGLLYGLGSADMKGGCAAMVAAFLTLARLLPVERQPPVGLLLVVDEEENGAGSATFLKTCQPPWAVIGEPTSLLPNFAHYGYLEAIFTTRGRRTHSSLPELGHNAVESMLRVLLQLGRDPLFDRRYSEISYSIREMTSSRAGFVVPDRCETWIDMHLPPHLEPATVEEAIRARIGEANTLIPDLNLEFQCDLAAPGYRLPTDNPVAEQLREIYEELQLPWRCDAFRSHSDGNLFYQAGVNPLILGPGALELAHTPEEYTPLAEVFNAARIYLALCLGAENI